MSQAGHQRRALLMFWTSTCSPQTGVDPVLFNSTCTYGEGEGMGIGANVHTRPHLLSVQRNTLWFLWSRGLGSASPLTCAVRALLRFSLQTRRPTTQRVTRPVPLTKSVCVIHEGEGGLPASVGAATTAEAWGVGGIPAGGTPRLTGGTGGGSICPVAPVKHAATRQARKRDLRRKTGGIFPPTAWNWRAQERGRGMGMMREMGCGTLGLRHSSLSRCGGRAGRYSMRAPSRGDLPHPRRHKRQDLSGCTTVSRALCRVGMHVVREKGPVPRQWDGTDHLHVSWLLLPREPSHHQNDDHFILFPKLNKHPTTSCPLPPACHTIASAPLPHHSKAENDPVTLRYTLCG